MIINMSGWITRIDPILVHKLIKLDSLLLKSITSPYLLKLFMCKCVQIIKNYIFKKKYYFMKKRKVNTILCAPIPLTQVCEIVLLLYIIWLKKWNWSVVPIIIRLYKTKVVFKYFISIHRFHVAIAKTYS